MKEPQIAIGPRGESSGEKDGSLNILPANDLTNRRAARQFELAAKL